MSKKNYYLIILFLILSSSCNRSYVIEKETLYPASSYLTLIQEHSNSDFFLRVEVDTTGNEIPDINVDIIDFKKMSQFQLERSRCRGKNIVFSANSIQKKGDKWILIKDDFWCEK
jgi:hypothetical protein